jgi:organic radical activating enzyme
MKLRYSEAFYSVQGEGKFVGVPSVFLRTFGCNFRCQNFGLDRDRPKEKHNPEVKELLASDRLNDINKFEDLPIIHTGCDTYASIYPEFKKFMMDKEVDEVVEHLLSLTPEGKWTMDNGQDIHLILTGGEPMLWQKFWPELLEHPGMQDLKNMTIETNGTQKLAKELVDVLTKWPLVKLTWSCSPKLTVSGESWKNAIKPEIVASYNHSLPDSNMYLKFVVADEVDVEEVEKAVGEYRAAGLECPVYLMPLGGRNEEYDMNEKRVAKIAMKQGWRFSPRLHLSLFGNAWGT